MDMALYMKCQQILILDKAEYMPEKQIFLN